MAVPRVAFDVGPLLGRRTGVGAAVEALRSHLAHDDTVDLEPYVISFRGKLERGVRRLPLPAAVAHRMWSRRNRPTVDRWLGHPDVVHGTNYVVPPSRAARVVSVYDCWFLRYPNDAEAAVVRAGQVLARALRSGAVAHASSTATADALRELFPGADVRTIALGAIDLVAAPQMCPVPELLGSPFIVSLSTLERRKNVPALVAAFGAIASAHADLRLVIAGGDGDDTAAVHAAIDLLGADLAERVILTRYVDDSSRSWLLHHAVALCYPSLDEGFGFPLLEAMQAGTPIVATRAGSIPEVAGDAALLVDVSETVGAADGLAEALSRVVADESLRRQLVTAGSLQLQGFSWSRTAAAMAELYRELADRSR